jgi:hypothetical protein
LFEDDPEPILEWLDISKEDLEEWTEQLEDEEDD